MCSRARNSRPLWSARNNFRCRYVSLSSKFLVHSESLSFLLTGYLPRRTTFPRAAQCDSSNSSELIYRPQTRFKVSQDVSHISVIPSLHIPAGVEIPDTSYTLNVFAQFPVSFDDSLPQPMHMKLVRLFQHSLLSTTNLYHLAFNRVREKEFRRKFHISLVLAEPSMEAQAWDWFEFY